MRISYDRLALSGLVLLTLGLSSVQGFWVCGECMQPHLYTGQRVLAYKLSYLCHAPRRGDIVIFNYPLNPKEVYVKRIVGLPGETVAIHNGDVFINRHKLAEPYKATAAHGEMQAQQIPAKQYFVLGDNRDVSDDSRHWGDLPRREIIGRAVLCYWPIRSLHFLR